MNIFLKTKMITLLVIILSVSKELNLEISSNAYWQNLSGLKFKKYLYASDMYNMMMITRHINCIT